MLAKNLEVTTKKIEIECVTCKSTKPIEVENKIIKLSQLKYCKRIKINLEKSGNVTQNNMEKCIQVYHL